MNLQALFLKFALLGAGWVLWLLVVLSLISVAIMVERGVVFARMTASFEDLVVRLRADLARGDRAAALRSIEGERSLEAAVARAGIEHADRGPDAAEEAMLGMRSRERLGLERNLAFLGTVGSNAPFIGLFGTVLGIIKAFHSLAGAQSANFKVVMADISEALVATGVGLLVAIPAVVAFNIFGRRVRAMVSNAEAVSHLVLANLRGEPLPSEAALQARARGEGDEAPKQATADAKSSGEEGNGEEGAGASGEPSNGVEA